MGIYNLLVQKQSTKDKLQIVNKKIKLFLLLTISTIAFGITYHLTQWEAKSAISTKDIATVQQSLDMLINEADLAFVTSCNLIKTNGADTFASNLHLSDVYRTLESQLVIIRNDSTIFWSSNLINPDSIQLDTDSTLFKTKNITGIYLKKREGDYQIELYIPLIYTYPFTNLHIKNHTNTLINCPAGTAIKEVKDFSRANQLITWKEKPILEVTLTSGTIPSNYSYFTLILILTGLLSLLLSALTLLNFTTTKHANSIINGLFIGINIILFKWISSFISSSPITGCDLFSPAIFASGSTFPGVGFFIIFATQLLAITWLFAKTTFKSRYKGYLPTIIQTIASAIFLFFISKNTIDLVDHSTFSLLIYKLTTLPFYSLLAFIAALLQFGAFYLFFVKTNQLITINGNKYILLLIRVITIATLYFAADKILDIPSCIAIFLLLFTLIYDFQIQNPSKLQRPIHWILITAFSLFLTHLLLEASTKKQNEDDLLVTSNLASSLASEHDFDTEYQLAFIEEKLLADKVLKSMALNENIAIETLEDHLLGNQFKELKELYDFQFILCWAGATLDIADSDSTTDCYNYFNQIILDQGSQIMASNFYFMNNTNGRKSYFGHIAIKDTSNNEVTIYIDLQSKLLSQGVGYPEILESYNNLKNNLPEQYSSAKYLDGKLTTSTGWYDYNPVANWIPNSENNDAISWTFENYIHTAKQSGETTIIVSREEESGLAFILLFSYHFLLTYLFIQFVFGSRSVFGSQHKLKNTLEQKLKYSFASMLIAAFLILGFFAIYYNYNQQKGDQQTVLKEKLSTIHKGLEQYIGNYPSLELLSNEFMVDMYLKDLSNMFKCDINLYDISGNLKATSRAEIFDKELISTKINPLAFFPIHNGNKKIAIHNEQVGLLNFSSLYMVLTNNANTPIGIVNVPFFVSSQNLTRSLTNYLVITINLFIVFLVITIIFSSALGRKFIRPINEIQVKMAAMKLGANNEKISYKGEDELKELVDQYNSLVDELEKSVLLLAQSEREMAWRKMARQIAHEIKNPLTPMRLSIQQLQRLSTEDPSHFKVVFEKTAASLIEQIDTLTEIASSFGTFAKTPKSSFEKIDINRRLEIILNAFQNMRNISINFTPHEKPVWIMADKNQTTQLINNLIKNAIQAIPKEDIGQIELNISTENNEVLLAISDNGKGIPDEIKDKLFEPNFTTKTSGMGLGLAISKNIVTSMDGKIWFTTNEKKGTTFFVSVPVIA